MLETLAFLVIFAEPGFPTVDVQGLPQIDGATETRSIEELRDALKPGRVLVWRHGSAFPAEAWKPVKEFLESGGSLLYLGGEPFARPVTGEPGHRQVGPRNLAMLKALRLNQCYRVETAGAKLTPIGPWRGMPTRPLDASGWVGVLEPRLCDTRDFPDEDGSPGSRDATVTPLAHLFVEGEERFPFAAAALAIDQIRGTWAGGRWVFWLASTPPTEGELAALIREAGRAPVELRVDPTFGCFHEGEKPSVVLRLHRPRAEQVEEFEIALTATLPDGSARECGRARIAAREHGQTRISLDLDTKPGLYRLSARNSKLETENSKLSMELPEVTTGFWIFDPALFSSGDELTLDAYTLRRGGRPEPVVGTTLMSGSMHRKFLFEPNAALWDDTFAELASLNINLVRTGVWSGWRKIAAEPGAIDESWLRSLEAFYLTARKHGVPVLFTFFAFLPEAFGGENPYFDPRALEGQRAYLSAVASRFAGAKEMLWDLINEPSFSSPKHVWACRPNGDDYEKKAFSDWLRARYGSPGAGPDDKEWESVVRARWRLAPDADIGLPEVEDFQDRAVFGKRRPYRAADYIHFAQESFTAWAGQMRAAIREAGSRAPITVGQDEGGLFQRPAPLFHHPAVDFTSMHTWWLNDALLWDGLAAKAAGKPLLVSETGVMQRELLSGEALRRPEDFARLLSRKIAYAFAAGAFGMVQWCYDVNPYMASDNEVAIGLKRVDGSYKPEHAVLRGFAEFVARNRSRFEPPSEPEVVVIVPTADSFSLRDHATAAVQRSVEALTRRCGVFPRLVPDHRASADLGRPRAIVLPACRGLTDAGWRAIEGAVASGSLLISSGWFESDDLGGPAARLGVERRPLAHSEVVQAADGSLHELRFPTVVAESWYAAAGDPVAALRKAGAGSVWHHPVPLEWADDRALLGDFYAAGLRQCGVKTADREDDSPPGVVVRRLPLRDSVLLIAINESPRNQNADGLEVAPFTGRMALMDSDRAIVDSAPDLQ